MTTAALLCGHSAFFATHRYGPSYRTSGCGFRACQEGACEMRSGFSPASTRGFHANLHEGFDLGAVALAVRANGLLLPDFRKQERVGVCPLGAT